MYVCVLKGVCGGGVELMVHSIKKISNESGCSIVTL